MATKMHPKIDARKRSPKGCSRGGARVLSLGPFWDLFPLKMRSKINATIDAEKVLKIIEKLIKNDAKIDTQNRVFLNIFAKR